jgi:hypothetical protein
MLTFKRSFLYRSFFMPINRHWYLFRIFSMWILEMCFFIFFDSTFYIATRSYGNFSPIAEQNAYTANSASSIQRISFSSSNSWIVVKRVFISLKSLPVRLGRLNFSVNSLRSDSSLAISFSNC